MIFPNNLFLPEQVTYDILFNGRLLTTDLHSFSQHWMRLLMWFDVYVNGRATTVQYSTMLTAQV